MGGSNKYRCLRISMIFSLALSPLTHSGISPMKYHLTPEFWLFFSRFEHLVLTLEREVLRGTCFILHFVLCSAGKYSSSASSSSCATCASGQYSSSGSTACSIIAPARSATYTTTDHDLATCFSIDSGPCTVNSDGTCFYSPNYPGKASYIDFLHMSSCPKLY